MNKKINQIRVVRGSLLNEDLLTISALLIKAGYTVRIVSRPVPGKKTKEKVIEYWEETTDA